MPTTLSFRDHLVALDGAGSRLVELAEKAGMDAPVPTCPAWAVDALLAHQAMVHRWATAHVRGDDPDGVPNQTAIRNDVTDLPGYYGEGHAALLQALRDAPADLVAITFLNDAPAPREFWARRQAHETTIHMVDALAATLGRFPTAADAGLDPALAADGIDELVRGFLTRGRSKLFDGEEYRIAVEATDVGRRWVLNVAERLTVARDDVSAEADGAATTIAGSAAEAYLALWNRGDEVEVSGRTELLDRWRATQRVTWS
jgi:uncharacterized protein (TIGR03083 family)